MKEPIYFCDIGNSIECKNRMDCELLITKLSNQKVDIIFNNFSLNTHPKSANLVIYVNNQLIIEFSFNYLREFYGYSDKWENVNIQLFHQEEIIRYKVDYGYRLLHCYFFILYDKYNDFFIKSKNLCCAINNQEFSMSRDFYVFNHFNNFNEFLKLNLNHF